MEEKKFNWLDKEPYLIADLYFKFIMKEYQSAITPRDYGTGDMYTLIETHTITFIDDNPGVSITDIAAYMNRTSSAASQIVSKLERKGLVHKTFTKSNSKTMLLFLTPEGKELSEAHKQYDKVHLMPVNEKFIERFSREELELFYTMMNEMLGFSGLSGERE